LFREDAQKILRFPKNNNENLKIIYISREM